MISSPFFLAGLTLILLHELDAVRCHEWRIFPGLSNLPDEKAQFIFLSAHIPILYWIFWQLTYSGDVAIFRTGFNYFLIIHVGLHLLYLKHPKNEFTDWFSWTIIIGAGLCGLGDLII